VQFVFYFLECFNMYFEIKKLSLGLCLTQPHGSLVKPKRFIFYFSQDEIKFGNDNGSVGENRKEKKRKSFF
jgi:hypothetical protein